MSIYTCKAQVSSDAYVDSLFSSYRAKAEQVLSYFIDTDSEVLLYTTDNQYYIITYSHDTYHEYYITADSLNRIVNIYDNSHNEEIEMLRTKKILSLKNRKYLSRLIHDKNVILDAFDTTQNPKGLMSPALGNITIFCNQQASYFVIKERNNILTEYFSESNIFPYPFNIDLSIYILRELALSKSLSKHKNTQNGNHGDIIDSPPGKSGMKLMRNQCRTHTVQEIR